jgi:hypothetical protein
MHFKIDTNDVVEMTSQGESEYILHLENRIDYGRLKKVATKFYISYHPVVHFLTSWIYVVL